METGASVFRSSLGIVSNACMVCVGSLLWATEYQQQIPRDPVAAAMVADAVRIIDNYIKVCHGSHAWLRPAVLNRKTVLCSVSDCWPPN